jgi:hypothetical protein
VRAPRRLVDNPEDLMRRLVATMLLASVSMGACTQAAPPSTSLSSTASLPADGGAPPAGGPIPRCADLRPIRPPEEHIRDAPIYVGNEMPVEAVQAWAGGRPGFEELWIDRDHHGWIVVAFSEGADERQREIAAEFPDDGVVAVSVDWTKAELEALQRRVMEELSPLWPVSVGSGGNYGVIFIGIGVLTPERIAEVERRFAGERVCVEGEDPANLPPAGPQAPAGDGWRLLADEKTGHSYRTGIAWDDESLRALWLEAGVSGDLPTVDFGAEVAVWFGAVYSGSCPNIRLDAVVSDPARRLVHAEIVHLDAAQACTADANPRAFVVAFERSRLPMAPFMIQLTDADPPGGVPEERTVVDADLRAPGSVAAPGQVHGDPALPAPEFVGPGGVIEPDFEWQVQMPVHCGIEWLGPLNSVMWRTEVPAGDVDFIPPEWEPVVVDEKIVLDVLMRTGEVPTMTAAANGHAVEYRASVEQPPGCD